MPLEEIEAPPSGDERIREIYKRAGIPFPEATPYAEVAIETPELAIEVQAEEAPQAPPDDERIRGIYERAGIPFPEAPPATDFYEPDIRAQEFAEPEPASPFGATDYNAIMDLDDPNEMVERIPKEISLEATKEEIDLLPPDFSVPEYRQARRRFGRRWNNARDNAERIAASEEMMFATMPGMVERAREESGWTDVAKDAAWTGVKGIGHFLAMLDNVTFRPLRALTYAMYDEKKRMAEREGVGGWVPNPIDFATSLDDHYKVADGEMLELENWAKTVYKLGALGSPARAAVSLIDNRTDKERLEALDKQADKVFDTGAEWASKLGYGFGGVASDVLGAIPGDPFEAAGGDLWKRASEEAGEEGYEGGHEFLGFMAALIGDPLNFVNPAKIIGLARFGGVGVRKSAVAGLNEWKAARAAARVAEAEVSLGRKISDEMAEQIRVQTDNQAEIDVILATDTAWRRDVPKEAIVSTDQIDLHRQLTDVAENGSDVVRSVVDDIIEKADVVSPETKLGISDVDAADVLTVARGEEAWAILMRESLKRKAIPELRASYAGKSVNTLEDVWDTAIDWIPIDQAAFKSADDAWKAARIIHTVDNTKTAMMKWAVNKYPWIEPFRRFSESVTAPSKAQPMAAKGLKEITAPYGESRKYQPIEGVMHEARFLRQVETPELRRQQAKTLDAQRVATFFEEIKQITTDDDTLTLVGIFKGLGRHEPASEEIIRAVAKISTLEDVAIRAARGELDELPAGLKEELTGLRQIEDFGEAAVAMANDIEAAYKAARVNRKDLLDGVAKNAGMLKLALKDALADTYVRQRELLAYTDSAATVEKIGLLKGYRGKLSKLIKEKKWHSLDAVQKTIDEINQLRVSEGLDEIIPILDEGDPAIVAERLQKSGVLPPGNVEVWDRFRDAVRGGLKESQGAEKADGVMGILDARAKTWAFWNKVPEGMESAWFEKNIVSVDAEKWKAFEAKHGKRATRDILYSDEGIAKLELLDEVTDATGRDRLIDEILEMTDGTVTVDMAMEPATAPLFYSVLERAIEKAPDNLSTVGEFRKWLSRRDVPWSRKGERLGLKKEELSDTLVADLNDSDAISKEELLDYVKANRRSWSERVESTPRPPEDSRGSVATARELGEDTISLIESVLPHWLEAKGTAIDLDRGVRWNIDDADGTGGLHFFVRGRPNEHSIGLLRGAEAKAGEAELFDGLSRLDKLPVAGTGAGVVKVTQDSVVDLLSDVIKDWDSWIEPVNRDNLAAGDDLEIMAAMVVNGERNAAELLAAPGLQPDSAIAQSWVRSTLAPRMQVALDGFLDAAAAKPPETAPTVRASELSDGIKAHLFKIPRELPKGTMDNATRHLRDLKVMHDALSDAGVIKKRKPDSEYRELDDPHDDPAFHGVEIDFERQWEDVLKGLNEVDIVKSEYHGGPDMDMPDAKVAMSVHTSDGAKVSFELEDVHDLALHLLEVGERLDNAVIKHISHDISGPRNGQVVFQLRPPPGKPRSLSTDPESFAIYLGTVDPKHGDRIYNDIVDIQARVSKGQGRDLTAREEGPSYTKTYDEGYGRLEGPKGEDYTEITFSLDDLLADEQRFWDDAHYNSADVMEVDGPLYKANIFLHLRFDTVWDGDKKVLRILEAQSDLHGQGRKKGYARAAVEFDEAKWAEDYAKRSEGIELDDWVDKIAGRAVAPIVGTGNYLAARARSVMGQSALDEAGGEAFAKRLSDAIAEADRAAAVDHQFGWNRARDLVLSRLGTNEANTPRLKTELKRLFLQLNQGRLWASPPGTPTLPDAPYKKSWQMLAMRRAAKWAADNGHTEIRWEAASPRSETTGRMEPLPAKVLYDEKLPREAKKIFGKENVHKTGDVPQTSAPLEVTDILKDVRSHLFPGEAISVLMAPGQARDVPTSDLIKRQRATIETIRDAVGEALDDADGRWGEDPDAPESLLEALNGALLSSRHGQPAHDEALRLVKEELRELGQNFDTFGRAAREEILKKYTSESRDYGLPEVLRETEDEIVSEIVSTAMGGLYKRYADEGVHALVGRLRLIVDSVFDEYGEAIRSSTGPDLRLNRYMDLVDLPELARDMIKSREDSVADQAIRNISYALGESRSADWALARSELLSWTPERMVKLDQADIIKDIFEPDRRWTRAGALVAPSDTIPWQRLEGLIAAIDPIGTEARIVELAKAAADSAAYKKPSKPTHWKVDVTPEAAAKLVDEGAPLYMREPGAAAPRSHPLQRDEARRLVLTGRLPDNLSDLGYSERMTLIGSASDEAMKLLDDAISGARDETDLFLDLRQTRRADTTKVSEARYLESQKASSWWNRKSKDVERLEQTIDELEGASPRDRLAIANRVLTEANKIDPEASLLSRVSSETEIEAAMSQVNEAVSSFIARNMRDEEGYLKELDLPLQMLESIGEVSKNNPTLKKRAVRLVSVLDELAERFGPDKVREEFDQHRGADWFRRLAYRDRPEPGRGVRTREMDRHMPGWEATSEMWASKRGFKLSDALKKVFLTSEEVADIKFSREPGPIGKPPSAAVIFNEEGKAIIKAFESADVTSLVHEIGHIFRRDLPANDLGVASGWIKRVLKDKAFNEDGSWSELAEEAFAQAFVRYIKRGDLPKGIKDAAEIKAIFDKLKEWLREVYYVVTGKGRQAYFSDAPSPAGVKLPSVSKDIKGVFDRLIDVDSSRQTAIGREVMAAREALKGSVGSSQMAAYVKFRDAATRLMKAAEFDAATITATLDDFTSKSRDLQAKAARSLDDAMHIVGGMKVPDDGIPGTGQFRRGKEKGPQAKDKGLLDRAGKRVAEVLIKNYGLSRPDAEAIVNSDFKDIVSARAKAAKVVAGPSFYQKYFKDLVTGVARRYADQHPGLKQYTPRLGQADPVAKAAGDAFQKAKDALDSAGLNATTAQQRAYANAATKFLEAVDNPEAAELGALIKRSQAVNLKPKEKQRIDEAIEAAERSVGDDEILAGAEEIAFLKKDVPPESMAALKEAEAWLGDHVAKLEGRVRSEVMDARKDGRAMARAAAADKWDVAVGGYADKGDLETLVDEAMGTVGEVFEGKDQLRTALKDIAKGPEDATKKISDAMEKRLNALPEAANDLMHAAEQLGWDHRSPKQVWDEVLSVKTRSRSYGDFAKLQMEAAITAFKRDETATVFKALSHQDQQKVIRLVKNRRFYGVASDASPAVKRLAKELGMKGTDELFVHVKGKKTRVADTYTDKQIENALKCAKLLDDLLEEQLLRLQQVGKLTGGFDPEVMKRLRIAEGARSVAVDPTEIAILDDTIAQLNAKKHVLWDKEEFLTRVNVASYVPHLLRSVSRDVVRNLQGRGLLPTNRPSGFEQFRTRASILDDINEVARNDLATEILYHNSVNPGGPGWAPDGPFAGMPMEELIDASRRGRLEDMFSAGEWDEAVKWARKTADLNDAYDFFETNFNIMIERYMRDTNQAISDATFISDMKKMFPMGVEIGKLISSGGSVWNEMTARRFGYSKLSKSDAIAALSGMKLPAELSGSAMEQRILQLLGRHEPGEVVNILRREGLNIDASIVEAFGMNDVYLPTPAVEYMRWMNQPDPLQNHWLGNFFDGIHALFKSMATISSLAHIGMNFQGNYASIAQKLGLGLFNPVNHANALSIFMNVPKNEIGKFQKLVGLKHQDCLVKIGDRTMTVGEWRKTLDELGVAEQPLSAMYLKEALGGGTSPTLGTGMVGKQLLGSAGGATVGAVAGGMAAGPVGAAAGGFLGHYVGAAAAELASVGWRRVWNDEVVRFGQAVETTSPRVAKKAIPYFGEKAVGMTAGGTIGSVFGPAGAVAGAIAGLTMPSYMRMMTGLNQSVEMQARLTLGVGEIARGATPLEAGRSVDDALRNYSHLTPIEKHVLRRVFFFYVWDAGNIRFQLHQLVKNPRQAAIFKNFVNGLTKGQFSEEEIQSMPENLRWEIMLRTGTSRAWAINGLPQQAFIENVARSDGNLPVGTLTRIRPDVLFGLEYLMDKRSLYYGKGWNELDNVRQFTNAPPLFKKLIGFPVAFDKKTGKYKDAPEPVAIYKDGRKTGKYRPQYRSTNAERFYAFSRLPGFRVIREYNKLAQDTFTSRALDQGEWVPATSAERQISFSLGHRPYALDFEAQQSFLEKRYMDALTAIIERQRSTMLYDFTRASTRLPPADWQDIRHPSKVEDEDR